MNYFYARFECETPEERDALMTSFQNYRKQCSQLEVMTIGHACKRSEGVVMKDALDDAMKVVGHAKSAIARSVRI